MIQGKLKRGAQRQQKRKKDEEVKGQKESKEKPSEPVQLFPLSEVQGGGMVHLPWTRHDLMTFTKGFPKLRESPGQWYTEVEE